MKKDLRDSTASIANAYAKLAILVRLFNGPLHIAANRDFITIACRRCPFFEKAGAAVDLFDSLQEAKLIQIIEDANDPSYHLTKKGQMKIDEILENL